MLPTIPMLDSRFSILVTRFSLLDSKWRGTPVLDLGFDQSFDGVPVNLTLGATVPRASRRCPTLCAVRLGRKAIRQHPIGGWLGHPVRAEARGSGSPPPVTQMYAPCCTHMSEKTVSSSHLPTQPTVGIKGKDVAESRRKENRDMHLVFGVRNVCAAQHRGFPPSDYLTTVLILETVDICTL